MCTRRLARPLGLGLLRLSVLWLASASGRDVPEEISGSCPAAAGRDGDDGNEAHCKSVGEGRSFLQVAASAEETFVDDGHLTQAHTDQDTPVAATPWPAVTPPSHDGHQHVTAKAAKTTAPAVGLPGFYFAFSEALADGSVANSTGRVLSMLQASQLRLASHLTMEGKEGEWRILSIISVTLSVIGTLVIGFLALHESQMQRLDGQEEQPRRSRQIESPPVRRRPPGPERSRTLSPVQSPEEVRPALHLPPALPPADVANATARQGAGAVGRASTSDQVRPVAGGQTRAALAQQPSTSSPVLRGGELTPRIIPVIPASPPAHESASDFASRVQAADALHVCPGLVVPRGNECLLAVPSGVRTVAGQAGNGSPMVLDVCEMSGLPMIKANILPPLEMLYGKDSLPSPRDARQMAEKAAPTVALWSTRGSRAMVVYCVAFATADGHRSAYVYDAHDEALVSITKVGVGTSKPRLTRPCYAVSSLQTGPQWLVDGNFEEHAVQVTTGEKRRILADSEPCSVSFDREHEYYRLRVTELVDVGLILCTLLAIDALESR